MSYPPPSGRAARGRAALAARARRVARLRRRVLAATLATFVLAWGAIAWQGSLGEAQTAQVTATSAAATATPDTSASSGDTSAVPSGGDLTTGQS